jgi:peptidoglycan/xylan/chitin deacetylase (PgdA/CDA1 family)
MKLFANRKKRLIIYYHGMPDEYCESFEKQVAYIAQRYDVLPLSELMRSENYSHKTCITITFDDGFLSVFRNAWPILKKYGLKATMFIPVGSIGGMAKWEIGDDWQDDHKEPIIDSDTMVSLDSEGFEIMSHTVSHTALTELPPEQVSLELRQSRKMLEDTLGHKVEGISYPLGRFNDQIVEAAKEAGYQYAVTVEPISVDNSPDKWATGRFVVSPKMNMLQFRLKVCGAYEVTKYCRAIKSKLSGSKTHKTKA